MAPRCPPCAGHRTGRASAALATVALTSALWPRSSLISSSTATPPPPLRLVPAPCYRDVYVHVRFHKITLRRRRRPRELQVVRALLHESRDAARGDQLGHFDHRSARPRALAARQPAGARVGDPRLPDRRHGARADGGSTV